MGTIVMSDVFQKKLDSIYIGLPGVKGISDDMIIYGTTEDEHDRNLLRFLQGWTLTRPKEDTIDYQHGFS